MLDRRSMARPAVVDSSIPRDSTIPPTTITGTTTTRTLTTPILMLVRGPRRRRHPSLSQRPSLVFPLPLSPSLHQYPTPHPPNPLPPPSSAPIHASASPEAEPKVHTVVSTRQCIYAVHVSRVSSSSVQQNTKGVCHKTGENTTICFALLGLQRTLTSCAVGRLGRYPSAGLTPGPVPA